MIDFLGFSLLARGCPVKTMELVYLCTGQTATSVAVRKHTQEATAKTVKALVSRKNIFKNISCLSYLIPTEPSFIVILLHTDLF